MNHVISLEIKQAQVLCKVTYCTGRISDVKPEEAMDIQFKCILMQQSMCNMNESNLYRALVYCIIRYRVPTIFCCINFHHKNLPLCSLQFRLSTNEQEVIFQLWNGVLTQHPNLLAPVFFGVNNVTEQSPGQFMQVFFDKTVLLYCYTTGSN